MVTSTKIKDAPADARETLLPELNRNFFYSCLVACSSCSVREGTIDPRLKVSVDQFDALRGPSGSPKADFRGMTQVLSDLSISMATMTMNHIQMNMSSRIAEYLKVTQGKDIKGYITIIVKAVNDDRKKPLEEIFTKSRTSIKCQRAMEVAKFLRSLLPDDYNPNFNSEIHKTLPLYYTMLKACSDTKERIVANKQTSETSGILHERKKERIPRTFNLLPMKQNFTIGYIPFSNMTILGLLKNLKLENHKGDGRDLSEEQKRSIWEKYFDLKGIETQNSTFDNRFLSDGYGVSVQVCGLSAEDVCDSPKLKVHNHSDGAQKVAADPGFSDIVTVSNDRGETARYSSRKYYEKAGFFKSARKTDKWNAENEQITSNLPTNQTTNTEKFEIFLREYLRCLVPLLRHREHRGYRKMRFFRYTGRQRAIVEICNLIAPRDRFSHVGFGDWNGGHRSCVSRRTSGPLKEIKRELSRRSNVHLRILDEYKSSQMCSKCHERLKNMRAKSVIVQRKKSKDGEVVKKKILRQGKIHKVLHCTSGKQIGDKVICRGTTWDRDVNASRNLLLILDHELRGKERPSCFRRS